MRTVSRVRKSIVWIFKLLFERQLQRPILSSPPPPLGCTAAPTPPTPWAALHQTSDSKPSGMLSQSTAAALTPPLLNQPPRESKLGDSGEYYWLKYLVSHKAVSSVTWGRGFHTQLDEGPETP